MSSVVHRVTKEHRPSAHTPDYPVADWIINPDLTALVGVPQKYWKIVGDLVLEMIQAEKNAVDAADAAALAAAEAAYVVAERERIGLGLHTTFVSPLTSASAAAANLAVGIVNAVSDPNLRQFVDLRGLTKCRIHGRIGGSITSANKIRLQFHTGGNVLVASGDAGWTTLADSAGTHALNTMFFSATLAVPPAAQVETCLVRPVLFDGNGVADPTISCCILDFYP